MLRLLPLLALLLALPAPPAAAQANSSGTLTCESRDNRYRECATGSRARARLVQNLSSSACIEGRTWGSRGDIVWVDGGCRGRFAVAGWGAGWADGSSNGGTLRCESGDNRYRECNAGFRGRAELARQLSDSRCVEGRTWGQRGATIWVDRGCRGEFVQGRGNGGRGRGAGDYGDAVTCSSSDQRLRTCEWDAGRGRPRLVEQLSQTPCREGYSWGYRDEQLWVSNGCRARFAGRR